MKSWRYVLLALLVPCLLPLPISAQWAPLAPAAPPPQWYWTYVNDNEVILWHNGIQKGNLLLDTLTYRPYIGFRKWGPVEDWPRQIPEELRPRTARRPSATSGLTALSARPVQTGSGPSR